jgi:hypothetical protein
MPSLSSPVESSVSMALDFAAAVTWCNAPTEYGQLAAFLMHERGVAITGTDILKDCGVTARIQAGAIEFRLEWRIRREEGLL